MITDAGKSIIAKYLIGDAPAYASFMALGCGQRPRANVTSLADVNTYNYSGNLSGAVITGLPTTVGLLPGMTLVKVSGTGVFGGGTGQATIASINSPTQITVTTGGTNTNGTITFYITGTHSVLEVDDTSVLWNGARLEQIDSFAGSLDTTQYTIVEKIINANLIRIAPATETPTITNADLSIGIDPRIQTLDFESLRVPITSRGYINDNGVNKIVMTAQLPSEERYEFTEIGIYSAGSNRNAGAYDSKIISAFTEAEAWELNANNSVSNPSPTNPLFKEFDVSIINNANVITTDAPAIKVRASNGVFANETRLDRYERPRFLDNVFMLRGNTSFIYKQDGSYIIESDPKFLQASSQIDFTKNSSSDLLKVAFTVVSVDGASIVVPDAVYVILEFSNSDGSQFAKMQIEVTPDDYDLANNRYIVVSKKLEELFYSPQFSWKTVNTLKVYTSTTRKILVTNKSAADGFAELTTPVAHNLTVGDKVIISGVGTGFDGLRTVTDTLTGTTFKFATTATAISQPVTPNGTVESATDAYYVALDGLRIDNINTINPLYGLVGYSIIQDDLRQTIVKSPNTTNFIEYRFVLDVT